MDNADFKYFPLVISSPSGGGKSTVKDKLLKKDKRFRFSITCTTREKRKGEINGRDYFFVTEKKFRELIKSRKLLEWAKVHGNYYGTPLEPVRDLLKKGFIPVMTIDVKGAHSVKERFPDAVTIFLLPPDFKTLVRRLRKRKETNKNIKIRIKTAKREIKQAGFFEYLVLNDNLENAVENIIRIADVETLKISRNTDSVKKFANELKNYQ